MEKAIEDLVQISRYAADHPRFIQGGGGNCSVKFSGKMAIKASGYLLEEVSPQKGYVILDLKTREPVGPVPLKPSIESPLHMLLATYVIHTHPLAVGAFVCSRQGQSGLRELFPESLYAWIDYANPGKEIFLKIKKFLGENSGPAERVLFLQNHGLFVAAETKKQCLARHEEVVRKCEAFFGPRAEPLRGDMEAGKYLTPDHAVYTHALSTDPSGKQALAARELKTFTDEVLGLIRLKGWDPHPLSEETVQSVLQLDGEQYRQQIWSQET